MTLPEVLQDAREGTRIRRSVWTGSVGYWVVSASGILCIPEGRAACLHIDAFRATDWERVPTTEEIEALRMAMLEAAQAALVEFRNTGIAGFSGWDLAKAVYEAAKGAI